LLASHRNAPRHSADIDVFHDREERLFELKLIAGCAVLVAAARMMFQVALRRK